MRTAERTRAKRCMSLEEQSGLPGPDVSVYMRSFCFYSSSDINVDNGFLSSPSPSH